MQGGWGVGLESGRYSSVKTHSYLPLIPYKRSPLRTYTVRNGGPANGT